MCQITSTNSSSCHKSASSLSTKVTLECSTGARGCTNRSTFLRRKLTCLSATIGIVALWGWLTFLPEDTSTPTVHFPLHGYHVPLLLTAGYLAGLPLLRLFTEKFCTPFVDMKALLMPSMIFYNLAQVVINMWMVYRFLRAVLVEGQGFSGDLYSTHTTYVTWVHYTNKYLEFLDTVFMVLRGRMDQVSFLHVYHHATIAWCWWIGLSLMPTGDSYFGALCNSFIHVLMYSYYALALLRIPCPWKKIITQAQLIQFASVIFYSCHCMRAWKTDEVETRHMMCIVIQVWEMSSLFLLFMLFYRKSYSKKKTGKTMA